MGMPGSPFSMPNDRNPVTVDSSADMAVDPHGDAFITDKTRDRILRISADGQVEEQWQQRLRETLRAPTCLAIGTQGEMFVGEAGGRILKFSVTGDVLARWVLPSEIGAIGGALVPRAMAVDLNGDLLLSEGTKDEIYRYSAQGKLISKWGRQGWGYGEFDDPAGLAVDSEGKLYVVDRNNSRVQVFERHVRP